MIHPHRVRCLAMFALVGTLLIGPSSPAMAQGKITQVVIGGKVRINLRQGDTLNGRTLTVEERVQNVDEVFAKHLGNKKGKITTKKVGERVHLYLNGDFVIAATPADAKAGGYKKVDALAAAWTKSLTAGFNEAKGDK